MKMRILLLFCVLLIGSSFFSYREFYQLNYSNKFHLDEGNTRKEFIIYPDTTIVNDKFKFNIKGDIEGKVIISAWAIYKSRKGSLDSSSIHNLKLENKSNIDSTLQIPYYGSRKGDKIVLLFQPIAVQRIDITIRADIFGLPFEWALNHFL